MPQTNFDDYVEKYDEMLANNTSFFGEESSYFAEYKVRILRQLVASPATILEYGCGIGRNIKFLLQMFPEAQIAGCDISQASLDYARARYPAAHFFAGSQDTRYGSYDVVLVSNVFHHVPPAERDEVMRQLKGFMKQDGLLFIFEHNPYNPVTQFLVWRCPYDKDAVLLTRPGTINMLRRHGLKIVAKKYTLFFPKFLSFCRGVEQYLGNVPMGGQYFVAARKT